LRYLPFKHNFKSAQIIGEGTGEQGQGKEFWIEDRARPLACGCGYGWQKEEDLARNALLRGVGRRF
jgi:hypothetical protein